MSHGIKGAAFTLTAHDGPVGMTLRDYFAAKVVSGIWANTDILTQVKVGDEAPNIAKIAYDQADAMLAERAK